MFKKIFLVFIFCATSVFAAQRTLAAVQPDEKKIYHPGVRADGLSRIDSEGNYIYDEKHELRHQSFHLRVGTVDNPDIDVAITRYGTSSDTTVVSFDEMYEGASKLSMGLDYEYFFTRDAGKLGVQAGFSFQYAEGKGRLKADPSQESIENFSFVTMPIFLGLIYRFEYRDRQYLAPYVSGGGSYTALAEKRDDRDDIKAIGSFGYYAAGGALLNLTAFDREMAGEFRTEYDISNLWINVEFRTVQVTSDAFNYQNNFIQGGISVDY